MLLPYPLTTSEDIAGVLRPGGHLRADSALRSLREHDLVGAQLLVLPRHDGRASGRAVWYSSLLLDVARLLRCKDLDGAGAVLAAANVLTSHRSARFVAEAFTTLGTRAEPHELDAASGGALSRLALLTESRRVELGARLHVRRSVGTVTDRVDDVVVIQTESGRRLGVLTPSEASAPTIGSALAIDTEVLDDHASFIWVRPAFTPLEEHHARVAGTPRLLTRQQRDRIAHDVLVLG